MAATSSPSGSDDPRPSADEAARALRDIDRHRGQARGAATHARWVDVVFGVVFFAAFAAPDFFGHTVVQWSSNGLTAFGLLYAVLLRTRRGTALLGQPVRPRKEELSKSFRVGARLTILAAVLAGFAVILLQPDWHLDVPYLRTAVGAVVGGGLALFGPRMQRALLSAAARSHPRTGESTVHGTR